MLVGLPVELEELNETAMWTDELREYVQTREDLVFHLEERSYHICRAHPLARAVIDTGVISADFACPRGGCPFAAASRCAGGRAVQLVAVHFNTTPSNGRPVAGATKFHRTGVPLGGASTSAEPTHIAAWP